MDLDKIRHDMNGQPQGDEPGVKTRPPSEITKIQNLIIECQKRRIEALQFEMAELVRDNRRLRYANRKLGEENTSQLLALYWDLQIEAVRVEVQKCPEQEPPF